MNSILDYLSYELRSVYYIKLFVNTPCVPLAPLRGLLNQNGHGGYCSENALLCNGNLCAVDEQPSGSHMYTRKLVAVDQHPTM